VRRATRVRHVVAARTAGAWRGCGARGRVRDFPLRFCKIGDFQTLSHTLSHTLHFPLQGDPMKLFSRSMFAFLATATLGATLLASPAFADGTYQVTGPVLEVSDTSITVQKGKEKWTLARDKSTKVTGELKVGAKVTIMYSMTATSVEVKGDKAAAKAKK
jgi:hypothetical protein